MKFHKSPSLGKTLCLGVGAAALLAGCASNNYQAEENIQGTALNKYLSRAYTKLAQAEYAENDFADAEYFGNKAKMAAMGEDVRETQLDKRDLSPDVLGLAYRARVKVVSMRRKGAFDLYPDPAAKLQAAHDCYLQEIEENHQPDDIAACAAELDKQYARLQELMVEQPKPTTPKKPAAPKEVAEVPVPGPFNVYFAFDSAELSEQAFRAIEAIAESAMDVKVKKVIVLGHTDTAGSADYNTVLGLKRANAVKDALMEAGLRGVEITVSSKGETSLQVQTSDDAKERLNRRVELTLSR